jgi:hypothetical protein
MTEEQFVAGNAFQPEEETVKAEEVEASSTHTADRPPTPEEEALADEAANDPDSSGDRAEVRRHYREMTQTGANIQGEGRVD